MVIATDTSQVQYKGCSYLISGYCCDPEKHMPSLGQTFGQTLDQRGWGTASFRKGFFLR